MILRGKKDPSPTLPKLSQNDKIGKSTIIESEYAVCIGSLRYNCTCSVPVGTGRRNPGVMAKAPQNACTSVGYS